MHPDQHLTRARGVRARCAHPQGVRVHPYLYAHTCTHTFSRTPKARACFIPRGQMNDINPPRQNGDCHDDH